MLARRLLLLGVAIVAVAAALGAGGEGPRVKANKPKAILRPGWNQLGLSAEQQEKLAVVQAAYRVKFQELQDELKRLQAMQLQEELGLLMEAQREQLRGQVGVSKKGVSKKGEGGEKK